jgi:hypothetical protein
LKPPDKYTRLRWSTKSRHIRFDAHRWMDLMNLCWCPESSNLPTVSKASRIVGVVRPKKTELFSVWWKVRTISLP